MKNLFSAYRVLATVVGILLTVLVFVAVPLKYFPADGTSAQRLGDNLTAIVGVTHGWCYIAYLLVAFFLSRRARWSLPFTVLTLLAGLLPIVIFFVEHQVVIRMRRDHPEVVATPSRV